jgi:hypothetical protein
MANKGHTEPDLFGGGYTHYDEKGNKIGRSEPNFFGGGYTNYDSKGNKIGTSEPNLFGTGYTNYDTKHNKVGRSDENLFGGGYTHYDSKGNKIGSSDPQLFGSGYTNSDSSDGCYIATCVYGSYDCPQVWTLRRFRDNTLKQSAAGRAFIHVYYAISPTLVCRFGNTKLFRSFWRKALDRLVGRLKKKSVADTTYEESAKSIPFGKI